MRGDPFRIEGPALISFSGGRTSGYMLTRIVEAHGGRLPADVYAGFSDTGDEAEGTYTFVGRVATHLGITIHNMAYGIKPGDNRRPFDRMIEDRKRLPNSGRRICTQWLKTHQAMLFMQGLGYETWTNALGLRADEQFRVAKHRGPKEFVRNHKVLGYWDEICPLADAGITKPMVLDYWSGQPFDLDIPAGEGNCVGCFLKAFATLVAIEQRRPGALEPMAERERRMPGRQFRLDASYDQIIAFARSQGTLPLPASGNGVDCRCHD